MIENHHYDPEFNLNSTRKGALVCEIGGYFYPMPEYYAWSYRYCPYCGQKLETGEIA